MNNWRLLVADSDESLFGEFLLEIVDPSFGDEYETDTAADGLTRLTTLRELVRDVLVLDYELSPGVQSRWKAPSQVHDPPASCYRRRSNVCPSADKSMSIRILIVDDHALVLEGLQAALANTEITIIAEASTGKAAVEMAMEQEVDVVLLDIKMPNGDGLYALEHIKMAKPNLPVLMHSMYENFQYVSQSRALGASGFLFKNVGKKRLIETVLRAHAGKGVWIQNEEEPLND
jgi:CheY-like chemotaxis protein